MRSELSCLLVLCAATTAHAQIVGFARCDIASINAPRASLLSQANTDAAGVVDQNFTDFPNYSTTTVDDFSTGGATWNIKKITMYYSKNTGHWSSAINTATLTLFQKSDALPLESDVPGNLGVIGAALIDRGSYWELTASTTGVGALQNLHGDYWIGLTPNASFLYYGQEYHYLCSDTVSGSPAALRNPGGAFGTGQGWQDAAGFIPLPPSDMCMLLEGDAICPADVDGSGFVDFDDFNYIVVLFELGVIEADFNGSGFVDFDDFNEFVVAYETGC